MIREKKEKDLHSKQSLELMNVVPTNEILFIKGLFLLMSFVIQGNNSL